MPTKLTVSQWMKIKKDLRLQKKRINAKRKELSEYCLPTRSSLEVIALNRIIRAGFPLPEPSGYRFHPTRKYEFDFAWPDIKLAIEIEGGVFTQGRHTRGVGYSNDCSKYNLATILGWRVLRYTTVNMDNLVKDLTTVFSGAI